MKNPRIFVLDDEPANLDIVRTILEREEYDVHCFRRPALALQAAEKGLVDLFLLDIRMPEIGGFEVCERLKANNRLKDVPVIFITAMAETFDKVKAFGIGAADFITKPFEEEELLARVGTHVRLYRTQLELEERVQERTLALRASEARMRQIFEHSPIALYEEDFSAVKARLDDIRARGVTDIDSYLEQHPGFVAECAQLIEVLNINEAAYAMHGIKNRAELPENRVKNFAEGLVEPFLAELKAIWNGAQKLEFDSFVATVTGERRDVIVSWSVLREHADDYARVLISVSDITDHKRTEEQLRQAQKMEAVGQLTGGIAHDFNNVLAVVLGNLELIERTLDPDSKIGKFTELAAKAAKRGATLNHRLLAFARKQPLDIRPVDLRELITDMDNLLRRSLGETIDLEVVHGDGLRNCDVDSSQLENALLNLAINARDAMPDGGKLTIETMNTDIDDQSAASGEEVVAGSYVMLKVTDTGAGIPADAIGHIFEPFYTTKEFGKGTGLGLSMVYGFVKQSNGHITVDSREGQGTAFKLYFPRSASAEAYALPDAFGERPMAAQGQTVLLVEDDDDVRSMVEEMLNSLGYQVLSADSGKMALDALSNAGRVDLLLSDVVLPGSLRGRELAEEARQIRPELKILFMSGYTDNVIIDRGRVDSGFELLQKPFTLSELAGKVHNVIGNAATSR